MWSEAVAEDWRLTGDKSYCGTTEPACSAREGCLSAGRPEQARSEVLPTL